MPVVIAAYEKDIERGMARAPEDEGRIGGRSHPALRMKEISKNDQARSLRLLQNTAQSVEIALPGCCRDGNSMMAKRRVLAEMQIGKIDGVLSLLPEGALRQQRQALSIPVDLCRDRSAPVWGRRFFSPR